MAKLAVVATLALAMPAAVARAECRVDVDGPADVRRTIEAWVATDCEGSLVVRVAPKGDALALTATGHGERIVPDANAAAALVASWVTPDPDATVAEDASDLAPIGVDDEMPALLVHASIADAIRTPHRMVAFGGVDHGVRAQLDVLRGGHWVVGVAGSIKRPNDHVVGQDSDVLRDAVLYVGTNLRVGKRLHVRAQFGIGIEDTQIVGAPDDTMTKTAAARRLTGHAETAVLAGIPIGRGWGVFGGPVFDRRLGADNVHTAAFFLGAEHGL